MTISVAEGERKRVWTGFSDPASRTSTVPACRPAVSLSPEGKAVNVKRQQSPRARCSTVDMSSL